MLYTRIRHDEKLLLAELRSRGHSVQKIDVRRESFPLTGASTVFEDVDIVIDRCLAASHSRYATRFVTAADIPVINTPATADLCLDKVKTSLALSAAGIPTPATEVAFSTETALETIERFGYPVVLKPVIGSWGRLMAKIESRSAAEAILEHKATLGHYEHKVFYIQEYVDKPGRDIRVLTVDGTPIAAMARSADHWLTNAATGASTTAFQVDDTITEIVNEASAAVGGGLLGVDLMETADGYTVHEINHTVEFKSLADTVDVDVPASIVDWVEHRIDTPAQASP